MENHKYVLSSSDLCTNDDDCDLPYMYWIPKLNKNPYKPRYIAESTKCTTQPHSKLFYILYSHLSKRVFSPTTSLVTSVVVLIQCGFWKIRKIFWKTSIQDYYQNTIAINLWFFNSSYFCSPYSVNIPTRKHYISLLLQKRRYT